ncbi:hypothetical protein ACFOU2_01635 [Bacillus songklensis]|uniref:Peptidase M43 pregnancy-associated plasma-A domain-containing protein n=1 Tax=Bacillus songklensis TaxID=1069116 RepID=A0ABV8AYE0_9BACI
MIKIKNYCIYYNHRDGKYYLDKSYPHKKNKKCPYKEFDLADDNHRTVATGTLDVCIIVLPGAQVDRNPTDTQTTIPNRVRREIAAANRIWQRRENGRLVQGVRFNVVRSFVYLENISGIVSNAENFPTRENSHMTMVQAMLRTGRAVCPNADVYVFYMNGNRFGPINSDYSSTVAITYNSFPIIIMTNASTSDYLLAHELGHFMFITNRFNRTADPEPFSTTDRNHNRTPTNLMFPSPDSWPPVPDITADQIYKALNSRVFYD